MPVRYFYEEDYKIKNPRKTALWIKESAKRENRVIGDINYVFCSDSYLLKLNQQFLSHTTYTDIITFDYSSGKTISGEIYISLDRVKENAIRFKASLQNELLRVMIHGVLHLCGYVDKKGAEKAIMRKKEEACLSLWKKMFHVKL